MLEKDKSRGENLRDSFNARIREEKNLKQLDL